MRKKIFVMTCFAVILPLLTAFGQEGQIIAPGAKLEKLADGFVFTEGPAADAQGNVLFTDQPNNRILKWSLDGKLSTFMEPSGRSNGLCFDRQGNLWACADEKNELWRIDPAGKITVVIKDYRGQTAQRSERRLDPPRRRRVFHRSVLSQTLLAERVRPAGKRNTYFLSPGGKKLIRVADDLKKPNGIIGTPDDKILYIADIGADKTYQYDIQGDGTLKNKKLFCQLGSDGMTIDNQGNVYLTGGPGRDRKGVTVFDKTGKQIEHIDVPEQWTANVCFGGKDGQTLFITASKDFTASA